MPNICFSHVIKIYKLQAYFSWLRPTFRYKIYWHEMFSIAEYHRFFMISGDNLDEATAFVEGFTSYFSFSRKRTGYSGEKKLVVRNLNFLLPCIPLIGQGCILIHLTIAEHLVFNVNFIIGVATFCKPEFTPSRCEEGLSGTLPSAEFDDAVGHLDGIEDEFSPEELRLLDNEGRCVITCHQLQVKVT